MGKFKAKKKRKFSKFLLCLILCFTISFLVGLGMLIKPNIIVEYIEKTHFMKSADLSSWFIKSFFGEKEEEIGKMEYIEDPNPTENKKEAIIYIYNTHQTEEYYIDFLMEHDVTPSVMTASYILREKLNDLNLNSMVETKNVMEKLNSLGYSYESSYKVSRMFMEEAKLSYPTLSYFIDLHRDSISYEASTLSLNDTSYAKALFVIGAENKNYLKNKELAEKISEKMNTMVNGISKGILEKKGPLNNGIYNQDFDQNVLLIELGSNNNNIMEVKNTLDILAKSIKEVI